MWTTDLDGYTICSSCHEKIDYDVICDCFEDVNINEKKNKKIIFIFIINCGYTHVIKIIPSEILQQSKMIVFSFNKTIFLKPIKTYYRVCTVKLNNNLMLWEMRLRF